jgi:hypothetical protein
LNPHQNPFQRAFISEVKRADELERKLRFFEDQIQKANEKIRKDKLGIAQSCLQRIQYNLCLTDFVFF